MASAVNYGMPPVPPVGDRTTHIINRNEFASDNDAYSQAPSSRSESASLPIERAGPAGGRPIGIVWLTFYFVLNGLSVMILGLIFTGLVQAGDSALSGMSHVIGQAQSRAAAELGAAGTIASLTLQALAALTFHLGLLTLVASYGLWTFHAWGLSLARLLSIVYAVLAMLSVILAVSLRVGIMSSVISLTIWSIVLVHLFASAERSIRMRQYYAKVVGSPQGALDRYR
ncbi:MAG: hypothetical protein JSS27_08855 [Planctomycetes bacterium]|nr:hypothetical protein [Planctomycetota bacterium]